MNKGKSKYRCFEHHHLLNDSSYHFRLPQADKIEFISLCKAMSLKHSSVLRHLMNRFVEENRENLKKIKGNIKKGVSCVSRQIRPLLTPRYNHYEPNSTIF